MDKNHLIQLTNKLYKLTLFFPKKEPLRYKMREAADELLAGFIFLFKNGPQGKKPEIVDFLARLEILDSFFEVAKEQNWVKTDQLLNLQLEYSNLKQKAEAKTEKPIKEFNRKEANREAVPVKVNRDGFPVEDDVPSNAGSPQDERAGQGRMPGRQQRIIKFLEEKGKAQVGDLTKTLSQVTKRTLRRDFENLLKQGLIQRIGEKQETYYKLKSRV